MIENKSIVWPLSWKVLIILSITFGIGVLLVDDVATYARGILLGGSVTLLKIKLLEITLKRAIKKPPSAAKSYMSMHYMLRYVVTFIVLFVGIAIPTISGVAVILALLSLKLAAYWQGALEPKVPVDGSVEFLEWEDDEETDF